MGNLKALRFVLNISLILVSIINLVGFPNRVEASSNLQSGPAYVQPYLQSGESIYQMISVSLDGKQYEVFAITTQPLSSSMRERVFYEVDQSWWANQGIQAVFAFDSNQRFISDPDLLRKIFLAQVGGYLETQPSSIALPYAYVPADQQIINDLKKITNDQLFLGGFAMQRAKNILQIKGDTDWYEQALLISLTTPDPMAVEVTEVFTNLLETGLSAEDALKEVLKMERFSNNASFRRAVKALESRINKWEKNNISNGLRYEIDGVEVDYANWIKFGALALNLAFLEEISKERADMLENLANEARAGNIVLSQDILLAIDTVVNESRSSLSQRGEIIESFVKENAVDLLVDWTEEKFREKVTEAIWQNFGTRITGHLVAGAFSSIFLGFNIANLIFGMDSIYENMMVVEYSAKFTDEIEKNLSGMRQKITRSQIVYPSDADLYRRLAIQWNYGIAQAYRSRANAVKSSLVAQLIGNIFSRGEWEKATKGLLDYASEGETKTWERLIHSSIIEYAITLPGLRVPATSHLGGSSVSILVFDTSGSMADFDAGGSSKIDAARSAGTQILNVIAAENSALSAANQVGVVRYSTTASVVAPLSSDMSSLLPALNSLRPENSTAMPDGLKMGIELFGASQGKQVLILLSDGLPNVGLNTDMSGNIDLAKQQVLDLASEAGQKNICVYTVGFGDPASGLGSIDEGFLQQVASASGCGQYYNARNAIDLANIYVELRHTSTGDVIFNQAGRIDQGQDIDLGLVAVAPNQETMLFTLNWPGSKLQPTLIDPVGVTIDQNYPGASISTTSSLVSIIVNNPQAGDWKLRIFGEDVPEGTTDYKAIISTRLGLAPIPTVTPVSAPIATGAPLALVTIVIAGGLVGVYAYSRSLRRKNLIGTTRRGYGRAQLRGISGMVADRKIVLQDGDTLGRGSKNIVNLNDPAVSRSHAVLRYANDAWFIQDLNSSGGIIVNGERVSAIRLNHGDEVKIGNQIFVFEID